jgi:phosphate starvation-inducible PhoH-like protein
MGFERVQKAFERNALEIAPLAFMRGRTLNNAFVILDEAQNATEMQLKMFLTRLGPSAKCIITGDLTQIDLPKNQRSGLFRSLRLLDNIEGIGVVHLESGDVVRHRLVKAIINAYDKDDEMQAIRKHERERDAQENEQKNKEENQ